MIKVRLIVTVMFHNGAVCFFRDIQMPALPPVGCVISSTSGEHDCMDVKRIWYLEELSIFVAELEEYDIRHIRTANTEEFTADGWTEETRSVAWPVFPFMLAVPNQTE